MNGMNQEMKSHEDFVDYYPTPKVDTTYYDDYEDYGN